MADYLAFGDCTGKHDTLELTVSVISAVGGVFTNYCIPLD